MTEPSVKGEEGVDGPSAENLEKVRAAVAALLKRARIARVVCVDDEFEVDVTDVIGRCRAIDDPAELPVIAGVDFSAPSEVWEAELQQVWETLPWTERRLIAGQLADSIGSDQNDQPGAAALAALLPDTVDFLPASPAYWQSSLATEVLESSSGIGTLVLFDRDLGPNSQDGMRLVAHLFDKDESHHVWAGLLTHTVTKETEHQQWKHLANESGIFGDRFVVISKEHLGPDPRTFPQSLKVTLMTKSASDLRAAVGEALKAGVEAAIEQVQDISPQEFERMVFLTSQLEGVWEPDTLLRIFEICVRTDVRKRLYKSQTIQAETSTLRQLASIETKPAPTTVKAQAIQHTEIYEDPEHLNRVHLPTELGDIYKAVGTQRTYILVEQPCDLMVRSDGKRGPELFDAVLLPIKADAPERGAVFELPAYGEEDGTSRWVLLARPELVPMQALDFCVFNTDGSSSIKTDEDAPIGLWPAWKARYARLLTEAKKIESQLQQIPSDHHSVALRGLLRIGDSHSLKANVAEGLVGYKVKRVGRLLPAYSRPLLTRYALHKAREAYEPRFYSSELEVAS